MDDQLRKAAHEYHRLPRPGKIAVTPTKGLVNQRDLALAYTPGVASVCETIAADPAEARNLTARGNLVAVITNGTAVLGLGAIGPLASKPVMEGKAVLFKKFAGIDVFDIEIERARSRRSSSTSSRASSRRSAASTSRTSRRPSASTSRASCASRMKIPVFHDDQHGTAIIVGAAILNGLKVVGKDIAKVKLVVSGAGAAALACLDLLVAMGLRAREHRRDRHRGRRLQGPQGGDGPREGALRGRDAARASSREVIDGADIFLGLSAGGVLKPEMVATHGRAAADPRARESRAGDPARGGAARRSPMR